MRVALPLDKMTTSDKLRVIEDVWDDLCRSNADIPSPAWHADILSTRERQIRNGNAEFLELDEAKKRLRNRLA